VLDFDVENQHISICVGMRVEPCFETRDLLTGDLQPKDGDADLEVAKGDSDGIRKLHGMSRIPTVVVHHGGGV